MYQIDNSTAATELPTPAAPGTAGYFTDGNPATDTPATIVPADMLNSLMLELLNVVTAGGISPSKTVYTNVRDAIKQLIASNTGNYALDTGVANAYVVALDPPITEYVNGLTITFKALNGNTEASTINAGGGVVDLTNDVDGALEDGDILSGAIVTAAFNSTSNAFNITSIVPSQITAAISSVFSTGDAKITYKTAADPGWILVNDGTIGNAASGATTRANADTSALFSFLWNGFNNTICPVSGGRGGSAASDYAANKTLQVPLALGRALGVAGSGAGLTARALGSTVGEETHTLDIAEQAAPTITIDDPEHSHSWTPTSATYGGTAISAAAGGSIQVTDNIVGLAGAVGSSATGISATASGGGGAHNNMQPTTFINLFIKL